MSSLTGLEMKRSITIAAFSLIALSQSAHADVRSDVLAGIDRCSAFADDRTWLNCLYGAAQPMRGKLGLPPAPASQTNLVPSFLPSPQNAPPISPRADTATRQNNDGGIFSYLFGGQTVMSRVPLTAYNIDHDGLFTVTLANGQVWRELDGSPTPHWHGPASNYQASIAKGALASYNFILVGEGTTYKVQRIQ